MILRSINPYTDEIIKEFEEYSDKQVDNLIINSGEAFEKWRRTSPDYRISLLQNVAGTLRNNINKYAGSITSEMGKVLTESKVEIEKCAWLCDYYAGITKEYLKRETVVTDADVSYVSYEPLGTVLGIMPWNFPFWQVFRFAVPTLMAGNSVLLKHASNVQICARDIERIFTGSGLPPGVFQNLVIGSEKVGGVIKNNYIKAVSLTGSEFAGQKVARTAGGVIKKSVLELGGSNAFIVLEDADIHKAVETGIKARMQNAGQSCIAAKRFIIHKNIREKFMGLFISGIKKLKTGDPLNESTDMGPLASIDQAEKVEQQVKLSIEKGARLILGGIRNQSFYQPTLLTDVRPGMPVFDEEVFGPVAPVIIAENYPEAIALANHTKFGLGVSLFTNDLRKADEMVSEFHDGAVFINSLVKSDPRLPFGGTRHSGYGRELAIQGIREFVNIKTVYIKRL